MFGEPERTGADLSFVLFGIPVRVHPMFWIVGLLFGLRSPDALTLAAWLAALFVGILIHELGHALVMRWYGFYPSIILYGMGGLATYGPARAYGARTPRFLGQIGISAAGPGAGFFLAFLIVVLWRLARMPAEIVFEPPLGLFIIVAGDFSPLLLWFVNDLLFISVFWGIINLLPIYPLDGGQIAREVMTKYARDGVRLSLMVSFVTAGLVAAYAMLQLRSPYMAIFFAYLAYSSYQMLAHESGRGRW